MSFPRLPMTRRSVAQLDWPAGSQRGFTLTEMAIALLILGLLVGGMLGPLSSRLDLQRTLETQKALALAREALLGFAAANGRLPCPAAATSNGQESFCAAATGTCNPTATQSAHGRCSNPYDGFVPAAALALAPVNEQGQLMDAWGNPIRYAITNVRDASYEYYFSSAGGIRTRWNSGSALDPDLRVCSTATGLTPAPPGSADCAAGKALATGAVAVIYSLGPNGATGGTDADESHNPNPRTTLAPDRAFVSHEPTTSAAAGGAFDDIVTWLSPHVLYNRMIAAGRLP